jgi:hypothetical protein
MLKKSAPVKNTRGEGYNFADNIAAKLTRDIIPIEVADNYEIEQFRLRD